jgi:hypothetical protein
MRTATIQRSSDAENVSMRLLAPASSESTTVGLSPVMDSSMRA